MQANPQYPLDSGGDGTQTKGENDDQTMDETVSFR